MRPCSTTAATRARVEHRTSSCPQAAAYEAAPRPSGAFDLDASCVRGRVALVFVDDASIAGDAARGDVNAQVWFQDLGARWHVAAETFSEYDEAMPRSTSSTSSRQ